MTDIKDYMVVLINEEGKINYLGYLFNFKYHAECLLDYAYKKYPNILGFKNLNYMEDPNSPFYYLSLLGNIIFTNVSVDDERRGVIYLPKMISKEQERILYDFVDRLLDFDVYIVYDMFREDGFVTGKFFDLDNGMNIKEKLNDYMKKNIF